MSTEMHDIHHAETQGGVGWKDVALGACSLLLGLGVAIIGIYASNLERDLERERISNVDQWKLLHELQGKLALMEYEHKTFNESIYELKHGHQRDGH